MTATACATPDVRASRVTIRPGLRVAASARHEDRTRARSGMVAIAPGRARMVGPPARRLAPRSAAASHRAPHHRTRRLRTSRRPTVRRRAPHRHPHPRTVSRRDRLRRRPARRDRKSRNSSLENDMTARLPGARFLFRGSYISRGAPSTTFGGVGQRESGAHADRPLGRNRPRRPARHHSVRATHDITPPSH